MKSAPPIYQSTGRRKTSIARLRLIENGSSSFRINKQPLTAYFPFEVLRIVATESLNLVAKDKTYDISVNVRGGGVRGQAEAIRLAVARVLCRIESEHKPKLRTAGYLTRDARMVERKKYSRRKARRRFQFSKR